MTLQTEIVRVFPQFQPSVLLKVPLNAMANQRYVVDGSESGDVSLDTFSRKRNVKLGTAVPDNFF